MEKTTISRNHIIAYSVIALEVLLFIAILGYMMG